NRRDYEWIESCESSESMIPDSLNSLHSVDSYSTSKFNSLRRGRISPPVVHVEHLQPCEVGGEARHEVRVVLPFARRPQNLGERGLARECHVLGLLGIGDVLRPDLPLRAEDV